MISSTSRKAVRYVCAQRLPGRRRRQLELLAGEALLGSKRFFALLSLPDRRSLVPELQTQPRARPSHRSRALEHSLRRVETLSSASPGQQQRPRVLWRFGGPGDHRADADQCQRFPGDADWVRGRRVPERDAPSRECTPGACLTRKTGHGGCPMPLSDRMSRPGCNPGQCPPSGRALPSFHRSEDEYDLLEPADY